MFYIKSDHEAGEDHAERGGGCVQDRGPQEHEDVHAALQQGLHIAQHRTGIELRDTHFIQPSRLNLYYSTNH